MEDLVEQAIRIINERYTPPYHTTAAVLISEDGRQYTAINMDHFTGYLCAETAALASALNDNVTKLDKIVAVGKNDSDEFAVINMCGKCRQILHDFAPNIQVAVSDDGELKFLHINELLPYGFKRRQNKIEKARRGEAVI